MKQQISRKPPKPAIKLEATKGGKENSTDNKAAKPRVKSSGAVKCLEQRPSTVMHKAKLPSPQTDPLAAQQRSAMTLSTTIKFQEQEEEQPPQAKSKYSSIRQKQRDRIVGVKAGQPKLIVNLDDGPSPMRALAQQVLHNRDSKRKITKKSKSQTIQASSQPCSKSQTGRGFKPRKFIEFLNQSLNQLLQCRDPDDELPAKQKHSNSADRQKVHMKYLNFHRKNVVKHSLPLRSATALNRKERQGMNKTQSSSADRIPRLTGSYSPKSKTGSAISRHVLGNDFPRNRKKEQQEQISARLLNNDSDKPKASPDRHSKVDQIIRENIKKEIQQREHKQNLLREQEASSLSRKNMIEKNNLSIRKLNQEKIQRRRLRLRDLGDMKDTARLEAALLATSDGAQQDKSLRGSTSYGRTQGMDFIDVRKEIISELKALKAKQKDSYDQQDPKHLKHHGTSLSLNQFKHNLIKNENMLTKRDKIRKFMKEKARQMQTKERLEKNHEINTVLKVRGNLTRLNEFVQSQLQPLQQSGISTPAFKVKRQNKLKAEQSRPKHERTTTPTRLFEKSDVSRSAGRTGHNKSQHQQKDTLYEDSRLSSIDVQDDRSAKRNVLGREGVLSVCFEKSASQKALRKQLRQSASPKQSRPSSKRRPRSALELIGSLRQSTKRKMKAPKRVKSKKIAATGVLSNELTLQVKFSDQAAAVVIQKEVRKYLGNLGFYEARETGSQGEHRDSPRLFSPDKKDAKIDLFIQPMSAHSSPFVPSKSEPKNYELLDPRSSSVRIQISPAQLNEIQKQKSRVPQLYIPSSPHSEYPMQADSERIEGSQSSSVFNRRNSFSKFSQNRLTDLLKDNEYQKLIKFREDCLVFREKKEKKKLTKLLQNNQMTPKTYQKKQEQIEKWVTIQKQEIAQTRAGFQQEWDKTMQMVEDTQKNVDFTKKLQNNDSNSYSLASSRANKPPRSVFIDEAPKSYRSGKVEPLKVRISDVDPSLGMLSSRDSQKLEDLINLQLDQQQQKPSEYQQSLTEQKHVRSGSDLEPSAEFIHRLEQHGMLEAANTLVIEEHSFAEDEQFDRFKNQVIKIGEMNNLFADSQHNSESEHKSEPMFQDKISEYKEQFLSHNELMTDKITDSLIEQLVQESLQLPTRQKYRSKPPQPVEADVYNVDQYSIEKEEKREWIEIRQRHVIEANLIRADQYVNEVVDALLQFEISDISEHSDFDYDVQPNDNFHIQFLKLLTQPIQRDPLEYLKLMQKSELGSYQHFETTLEATKYPIVSVDMYLEIEKIREQSLAPRRAQADKKKLQVWESIHIYNKCIFDAVNESLMKFRPYGLVGQPMPWSSKVRRLQTKVEIASVDTERLFQMVKQEIFRWSQVLCGNLSGPVFMFPNPKTGQDEFAEDLLQETRERRLAAVMTQDTVEQEHHWLNYEFEETQVKIDLADMILETLVAEIAAML